MKQNGLSQAFRNVRMDPEAEERILAACRQENACRAAFDRPRRTSRRILAVGLSAALLVAGALGIFAFTQMTQTRRGNHTHLPATSSPLVAVQDTNPVTVPGKVAENPWVFQCNAVTGGGDLLYFDVTVTRKDGSALLPAEGDTPREMAWLRMEGGSVTFADGTSRPIYAMNLADSTDTVLHLECQALIDPKSLETDPSGATISFGTLELTERYIRDVGFRFASLADLYAAGVPGRAERTTVPYTDRDAWMLPAGENRIVFADAFPDAYIDNYAYTEDGTLLLSVVPGGGEKDFLFMLDGQRTFSFGRTTEDGRMLLEISGAKVGEALREEQLHTPLTMTEAYYEYTTLAVSGAPVPVDLSFQNETRTVTFSSPVTIRHGEGWVTLRSAVLDNTHLTLYGEAKGDGEGNLGWLDLNQAFFTMTDGSVLPCGSKNGCGTSADGAFELQWLLATVADPARVVSVTVNGVTIDLT